MAIKINELLSNVGPGARTNKYRVIFPVTGVNSNKFDVLCNEVAAPGRSISSVEVFLKGRKYLLSGDRAEEGTFTASFYNDPNLILRNIFLSMIESIESYETPNIVFGGANINYAASGIIQEINYNLNRIKDFGINTFNSGAWYQSDVVIQQLNENSEIIVENVYHEAFITDVSEIQYTDETGDVSKTTITVSYTGSTIL